MTTPSTDDRLAYLESMMANFLHVMTEAAVHPETPVGEALAGMPSIVRHSLAPEPTPLLPAAEEMLIEHPMDHHYVIPDGYAMPADTLEEAQQQYADVLRELEGVNRALTKMSTGYTDLLVRPPHLDQALIVIIPLLHAIAQDVRENLAADCATCKPVISQGLAKAVLAWVDASVGQSTAISEFADWAWTTLGDTVAGNEDEKANIVLANLKATGVI